jgi:hypothetical protein
MEDVGLSREFAKQVLCRKIRDSRFYAAASCY